ncbi:basic leucine zipper 1-like [Carica papaya]|uniref:basic leucine zipper 1-like n=1 Tax=Carica papaya TaxID=3649 RepID=UPI000B8CC541|nr:basic leucine zipper 1-like [Carica papaya]
MVKQGIQLTNSVLEKDARYAVITDEKRRKRMLSNRESARRSRLRRQKQIEDLVNEIALLNRKIQEGNKRFDIIMESNKAVESENNVLRAEKTRLANYMFHLEIMILNSCMQVGSSSVAGCSCDGQSSEKMASPELCRVPWQVGGATQPIISPGIFEF